MTTPTLGVTENGPWCCGLNGALPMVVHVANWKRARHRVLDIFVSYRRHDTADVTGRIFDHLKVQFGQERLFKDVDSIRPGDDFPAVIEEALGQCKVFLAVIGDDWLDVADKFGRPRIQDPKDYVHIEIAAALRRDIPLIPVLVEGQEMPSSDVLPAALQPLAVKNAATVRPDPDFQRDMERLCDHLAEFAPRRAQRLSIPRLPWFLLSSLAIGIVCLAVATGMGWLNSGDKLTPAEREQFQRHVALGDAFDHIGEPQSALDEYRTALLLLPDDKELLAKIRAIQSPSVGNQHVP